MSLWAIHPQPWIRLGGAISLLAVGYLGGSLGVGWLAILVFAILLLQVGLDVYVRLQWPYQEMAQYAAAILSKK